MTSLLKRTLASLLTTMFIGLPVAHADTAIDFDAATPRFQFISQVVEDGFLLKPASSQEASIYQFDAGHPYLGSYSGAYTDTPFLTVFSSLGAVDVSRVNGETFDLTSLDAGLGYFNTSVSTASAMIIGKLQDGSTVSREFQLDKTFQTQQFGFKNLISFSFTASAPGYVNIDNIRVTAVPEPTSALLMLIGVLLLSFLFGRRRSNGQIQC